MRFVKGVATGGRENAVLIAVGSGVPRTAGRDAAVARHDPAPRRRWWGRQSGGLSAVQKLAGQRALRRRRAPEAPTLLDADLP
jgi:hypothetical protein